ncbi:hypothetical protein DOY81_009317 [Sarcophaga bullata]|nr:hypothetical protein DOY81_009317 [Sarcophaga bullata]
MSSLANRRPEGSVSMLRSLLMVPGVEFGANDNWVENCTQNRQYCFHSGHHH